MFANNPVLWIACFAVTGLLFVIGYVGYPGSRNNRNFYRNCMCLSAGGFAMCFIGIPFPDSPAPPAGLLIPIAIGFTVGGYLLLRYLEGPHEQYY